MSNRRLLQLPVLPNIESGSNIYTVNNGVSYQVPIDVLTRFLVTGANIAQAVPVSANFRMKDGTIQIFDQGLLDANPATTSYWRGFGCYSGAIVFSNPVAN